MILKCVQFLSCLFVTHRNRNLLFLYLLYSPFHLLHCTPSASCIVHSINVLYLARFLGFPSCLFMIYLCRLLFSSPLALFAFVLFLCLLFGLFRVSLLSLHSLRLLGYAAVVACAANSFSPVAFLVFPKNSRTFCAPRSM